MSNDVLFDRITKLGEDRNAVFQMTWGSETADCDIFGCAVVGYGHTIALDGPRMDWVKTLTTVLDVWDDIKKEEKHG